MISEPRPQLSPRHRLQDLAPPRRTSRHAARAGTPPRRRCSRWRVTRRTAGHAAAARPARVFAREIAPRQANHGRGRARPPRRAGQSRAGSGGAGAARAPGRGRGGRRGRRGSKNIVEKKRVRVKKKKSACLCSSKLGGVESGGGGRWMRRGPSQRGRQRAGSWQSASCRSPKSLAATEVSEISKGSRARRVEAFFLCGRQSP